jgi:hypothetical protein
MSLYLVRREAGEAIHPYWSEIEQTYGRIECLFDQIQAIYRPMVVTMIRSPLGQLVAAHAPKWRCWLQPRGRSIELDPPVEDLAGDFDPMLLGSGLDAVVAWRAERGDLRRDPRLSWRTNAGFFEVCWDEVRTPGDSDLSHGEDGAAHRPNSSRGLDSLALPLLKRIIAAHGGHLELTCEPSLRLRLRWPQVQVGPQDQRA